MDFSTSRTGFADTCAWVAQAVARNPQTPAMAGILMRTEDSSVVLTGFDGNTVHRAVLDAEVRESGQAVASGRFLVGIAGAMKAKTVRLAYDDTDGRYLTISAGAASYRAQCALVREYPRTPEFPKHVGRIHADSLTNAIAITEHALGKNPFVPELMALNVVGHAGVLQVTALDLFRIARTSATWADASAEEFVANVPGVQVAQAARGLSGDVEIGSDGELFGLSDERRTIVTRGLAADKKYPELSKVLAREAVLHIATDSTPILDALKRAAIVNPENATVSARFTQGLLELTVEGRETDGSEEIECAPGFGEGEMTLKFNAAYLGQSVAACPSERILLGLTGPGQQMYVQPIAADGSTDGATLLVVMPRGSAQ